MNATATHTHSDAPLASQRGPRSRVGGARRRLRRHRHQPALRDARGVPRSVRLPGGGGQRAGRPVADDLGVDPDGRDQVPDGPAAGRPSGPGRHPGAAHHPHHLRAVAPAARLDHHARPVRRLAALRRRHHHPRDVGVVRGRGSRSLRPGARPSGATALGRHSGGVVRGAAARNGLDWKGVRPHRPHLAGEHRTHRAAWRPDRARRAPGLRSAVGGALLRGQRAARIHGPLGGGPGRDRGRSALRRPRTLRPRADPYRGFRRRDSVSASQLPRPGGAPVALSRSSLQPVLRVGPTLAAEPHGGARDGGGRGGVAGAHHGVLLVDAAARSPRLHSPRADRAPVPSHRGADLRSTGEHLPDDRLHLAGPDLP